MKRFGLLVMVVGCSDAKESKPAAPAPAPVAAPEEPAAPVAAPTAPVAAPAAPTAPAVPAAPAAATDDEAKTRSARDQAIERARTQGVIGVLQKQQQGGGFASITGTGTGIGTAMGDDPAQSGFGSGRSGASGSAVVGKGDYGVLGHGKGTEGYGDRGGMRGRTITAPQTRIGAPRCTGGDLDTRIVRHHLKSNIQRISYCYEKQLVADPALAGTVTAQFTIGGDGKVTGASAGGVHADVSSCVVKVIEAIAFPAPKDGAPVQCGHDFGFTPAGR